MLEDWLILNLQVKVIGAKGALPFQVLWPDLGMKLNKIALSLVYTYLEKNFSGRNNSWRANIVVVNMTVEKVKD